MTAKSHKNAKARREKKKADPSSSDSVAARSDKGGATSAEPQRGLLERTVRFVNGVKAETKRVSWPSKPELIAGTITSVFILTIFATWLGGLDFLLRKLLG